jgi:L-cysteate sulfo-lyase
MDIEKLLTRFDRVPLTNLPTPLEHAKNLTRSLGGPEIYFKRDDCMALAFGGNKTRKLEYVMAEATRKSANVMITIGGLQSNWARQMAAAARKMGMDVVLVLEGKKPESFQGNLLLDLLMGCELRFQEISQEEEDREIQGECPITGRIAEELRKQGKVPYTAPLGAATPLGNLGYVNAVLELKKQTEKMGLTMDYLVVTTGTGGTQAGVELGVRLLNLPTKVIGLSISRHTREKAVEISELCNKTLDFLHLEGFRFSPEEIIVNYDYMGEAYGVPTEKGIEAIKTVAKREGVILCPVYTGKAMAGLIDLVQKGFFKKGENVVFLHTGGGPANFAYNHIFQPKAGEPR